MKAEEKYTFELAIKVRDYEVDAEGIVNNANYLHYMEHTRHEFCQWAGLTFREMHANGIDPVVRRVDIEYFSPLTLGSEMMSKLRVKRKGARFIFVQDIFIMPTMTLSAHAEITVVTLENGRLSRGEVLFDAFKDYLEDE